MIKATWQTPVHAAARQNDRATVEELADRGADLDALDSFGLTPLARAVELGREDTARLLLGLGCDPRRYGPSGYPPLLLAAANGMLDMVRLLLDHGVHPDTSVRPGSLSALMCAAQFGHRPVVRLLADRGATIDATDDRGQTALFYATVSNCPQTCQLLLKLGADVNARDELGETALHQLVKQRLASNSYRSGMATSQTLAVLLQGGADPQLPDGAGRRCLELAVLHGRRDYARFLLRALSWAQSLPRYARSVPRTIQARSLQTLGQGVGRCVP